MKHSVERVITASWRGCLMPVLCLSAFFANAYGPAALPSQTCAGMSASECEMLKAVNRIRLREKLPELKIDIRCVRMAQEQARDMAARGYFSHTRPEKDDLKSETFSRRVRRFKLKGSAAENLATSLGYGIDESLKVAVSGWLKSPGHRKNLLSPAYRYTGVGHYRWSVQVAKRRGTRTEWHDNWVQVFSSLPGE